MPDATLEIIIKTVPSTQTKEWHGGDILAVWPTSELADLVNGEYKSRESIENSPFIFVHVKGVPDNVDMFKLSEEYRVGNTSPDLDYVRENPTILIRRRKWFINPAAIVSGMEAQGRADKEITVNYDLLKTALAQKSVPDWEDINQDGVADYLQDSDL